MSLKILFKYTTKSRRSNFLRGAESIIRNITESKDYHILISLDKDDEKMKPLPILSCNNYTYIVGDSKSKIDAINRDVNDFNYSWDILVNFSDDMVFVERGFDNIIRASFDNLDQCLHFPDGNRSDLITMSVMGRDYYNRFKYIYHPDYLSVYCDDEQTEVAKILGCYKYVHKSILHHLHPAFGKGLYDAQYQHTESFFPIDEQTYLRRKAMNYGL